MKRAEIEELAGELSHKAAENLKAKRPDGLELMDIPSFAAGMRFARDGFIETLRAIAQAARHIGKTDIANAIDQIADDMPRFPILGE